MIGTSVRSARGAVAAQQLTEDTAMFTSSIQNNVVHRNLARLRQKKVGAAGP